jgi:hypothetical protein
MRGPEEWLSTTEPGLSAGFHPILGARSRRYWSRRASALIFSREKSGKTDQFNPEVLPKCSQAEKKHSISLITHLF